MSKSFGLVLVSLGVGAAALALLQPELPSPAPAMHFARPVLAPAFDHSLSPPNPALETAPPARESTASGAPPPSKPVPVRRVDLAELPQRIAVTRDAEDMKSPGGKAQMARDIQRNLKRVGCYTGDINGDWSPLTRRAMKSYLDEVNASLPVDQPQIALLALLESQALPACGAPCGPNALRAGDGRCRSMPAVSGEIHAVDARVSTPPLDGQMSLAGPGATGELGPDSALTSATPAVEPARSPPQKRARTPNKFGHPTWAFSNNPN